MALIYFTITYICNITIGIQYTPTLNISEVHYESDNVTVTVKWIKQMGISYNIRVLPSVMKTVNGSTGYQLILSHNTEYNLSVAAVAPCGINATAFIILNYGELSIPIKHAYLIIATSRSCEMSCIKYRNYSQLWTSGAVSIHD